MISVSIWANPFQQTRGLERLFNVTFFLVLLPDAGLLWPYSLHQTVETVTQTLTNLLLERDADLGHRSLYARPLWSNSAAMEGTLCFLLLSPKGVGSMILHIVLIVLTALNSENICLGNVSNQVDYLETVRL